MAHRNPAVEKYGWTAVPRKVSDLLQLSEASGSPSTLSIADIAVPNTPLAAKIQEYAKDELPIKTYHHSMRVYYYGSNPLSSCYSYQVLLLTHTVPD